MQQTWTHSASTLNNKYPHTQPLTTPDTLPILNLVIRSLLQQFDIMPKKDPGGGSSKKDNPEVKLSVEEKYLLELAKGLDQEELIMAQEDEGNDNEDGSD